MERCNFAVLCISLGMTFRYVSEILLRKSRQVQVGGFPRWYELIIKNASTPELKDPELVWIGELSQNIELRGPLYRGTKGSCNGCCQEKDPHTATGGRTGKIEEGENRDWGVANVPCSMSLWHEYSTLSGDFSHATMDSARPDFHQVVNWGKTIQTPDVLTFIIKSAVVTVHRGDGHVTICYLLDGQPGANGNCFTPNHDYEAIFCPHPDWWMSNKVFNPIAGEGSKVRHWVITVKRWRSTNPWIVQSSPFRFSYVQNPAKSISSMELDALEQHSALKSALRAENSRFLVASSLSFHASAARRLACASHNQSTIKL